MGIEAHILRDTIIALKDGLHEEVDKVLEPYIYGQSITLDENFSRIVQQRRSAQSEEHLSQALKGYFGKLIIYKE